MEIWKLQILKKMSLDECINMEIMWIFVKFNSEREDGLALVEI